MRIGSASPSPTVPVAGNIGTVVSTPSCHPVIAGSSTLVGSVRFTVHGRWRSLGSDHGSVHSLRIRPGSVRGSVPLMRIPSGSVRSSVHSMRIRSGSVHGSVHPPRAPKFEIECLSSHGRLSKFYFCAILVHFKIRDSPEFCGKKEV